MSVFAFRFAVAWATLSAAHLAQAITIQTVPVENPGNSPDTAGFTTTSKFGKVDYSYRIGKYEVTTTEYVAFLNTVAATDPYQLWSSQSHVIRSGANGGFTYTSQRGWDQRPVTHVNYFDVLRFLNWLHNGQGGPGTTEFGAYTLEGGVSTPTNAATLHRNAGADWFLPSEDEWYKAAHYSPGPDTYFTYPTGSNTAPLASPPTSIPNAANYNNAQTGPTLVGLYPNAPSPYGTFDQGGNVWEWTDTPNQAFQVCKGGAYDSDHTELSSSLTGVRFSHVSFFGEWQGFRVATVIPEPTSGLLVGFGMLLLAIPRGLRLGRDC